MSNLSISTDAESVVRKILEHRTCEHQSYLRDEEPPCSDCQRIAHEIVEALQARRVRIDRDDWIQVL